MCVFLCQIALTLIYPTYIYGFVPMAPSSQKFYIALLPLLKVLLKNWSSRFLGELDELKLEVVIFNVELFNALYVSCCKQQSSSITTTLVITSVDFVQVTLSLRAITLIHDDALEFMALTPVDHPSLRAVCANSGSAVVSLVPNRLPSSSIVQSPALVVPVSIKYALSF